MLALTVSSLFLAVGAVFIFKFLKADGTFLCTSLVDEGSKKTLQFFYWKIFARFEL